MIKKVIKTLILVAVFTFIYSGTAISFIYLATIILITYPILPQCGMTCLEIGFLAGMLIIIGGGVIAVVPTKFIYDRYYYRMDTEISKRLGIGDHSDI